MSITITFTKGKRTSKTEFAFASREAAKDFLKRNQITGRIKPAITSSDATHPYPYVLILPEQSVEKFENSIKESILNGAEPSTDCIFADGLPSQLDEELEDYLTAIEVEKPSVVVVSENLTKLTKERRELMCKAYNENVTMDVETRALNSTLFSTNVN